ncbi:hypothetical protein [Shewanella sp.]|uniref:hypothetical protein n=1 Tax=Shewanella sp. TaxID=50422 RepID=UPI003565E2D9
METHKVLVGKVGNTKSYAHYQLRDKVEPSGNYDIEHNKESFILTRKKQAKYFDNLLEYQLCLMSKHLESGVISGYLTSKLIRKKSNPRGKCFKRMLKLS